MVEKSFYIVETERYASFSSPRTSSSPNCETRTCGSEPNSRSISSSVTRSRRSLAVGSRASSRLVILKDKASSLLNPVSNWYVGLRRALEKYGELPRTTNTPTASDLARRRPSKSVASINLASKVTACRSSSRSAAARNSPSSCRTAKSSGPSGALGSLVTHPVCDTGRKCHSIRLLVSSREKY